MAPLPVTFRFTAHWLTRALLYPFARPYLTVDGDDVETSWNRPVALALPPGKHEVAWWIRYQLFGHRFGPMSNRSESIHVRGDGGASYTIANGPLNNDPFLLREA
jgi:hypothetical protein